MCEILLPERMSAGLFDRCCSLYQILYFARKASYEKMATFEYYYYGDFC
jgi:hypothetical protein